MSKHTELSDENKKAKELKWNTEPPTVTSTEITYDRGAGHEKNYRCTKPLCVKTKDGWEQGFYVPSTKDWLDMGTYQIYDVIGWMDIDKL